MHKLMELKEKLINELEDYADNGKFSKEDVEAIKYTASVIDHICNIVEDMEDYSMEGGSYARGGRSNARGGSYNSYARGRKRDSMGRYSRYNSYADGEMAGMVDEIYSMMDRLPEDARRDAEKFVKKLENM